MEKYTNIDVFNSKFCLGSNLIGTSSLLFHMVLKINEMIACLQNCQIKSFDTANDTTVQRHSVQNTRNAYNYIVISIHIIQTLVLIAEERIC